MNNPKQGGAGSPHLIWNMSLPVEHERIRAELGCGVDGGPEEEEDGVQEVVPVRLFLRHHLHHCLLHQRPRAVVQRVELRLVQRRNLLDQVPPVPQQPGYLQIPAELSQGPSIGAHALTAQLTSSQKSTFWAQTIVLGAPNLVRHELKFSLKEGSQKELVHETKKRLMFKPSGAQGEPEIPAFANNIQQQPQSSWWSEEGSSPVDAFGNTSGH